MKIKRTFGSERDFDYGHGKKGICKVCGLDYFDVERASWSRNPDMSANLDVGIAGFFLEHDKCKACERRDHDQSNGL